MNEIQCDFRSGPCEERAVYCHIHFPTDIAGWCNNAVVVAFGLDDVTTRDAGGHGLRSLV